MHRAAPAQDAGALTARHCMEAAAPASVVVDVPATVDDTPASGVGASEPTSDGDAPSSSSSSSAPEPELPAWALAVAGDDDSDEDEEDCHICRLTAEEMGEPLIRPCACASMPVHASCRELCLTTLPAGPRLHSF